MGTCICVYKCTYYKTLLTYKYTAQNVKMTNLIIKFTTFTFRVLLSIIQIVSYYQKVIQNKNYGVSLWSYIHFKIGPYMIKKKCDFTAFHNFLANG